MRGAKRKPFRKKFFWPLVSALILASTLSGWLAATGMPSSNPFRSSGGLKFTEVVGNLGVIGQGETAEYVFHMTNESKTDIFLRGVETSCTCTTPMFSPGMLQAGESRALRVTLKGGTYRGRVWSLCFLTYSNVGSDEVLRQELSITAIVEPDIRVSRDHLVFSQDGPQTMTVRLSSGRLKVFQVLEVMTTHRAFAACASEADDFGDVTIHVKFDPGKWRNLSKSSTLRVHTTSPAEPWIEIPLSVQKT